MAKEAKKVTKTRKETDDSARRIQCKNENNT